MDVQTLQLAEQRTTNRLLSQLLGNSGGADGQQIPLSAVLVVPAPYSFDTTHPANYAGGSNSYPVKEQVQLQSQNQLSAKFGQMAFVSNVVFAFTFTYNSGSAGFYPSPNAFSVSAALRSPIDGRYAAAALTQTLYQQTQTSVGAYVFEASIQLPNPVPINLGSSLFADITCGVVLPQPLSPSTGTPIATDEAPVLLADGGNVPVSTFTNVQSRVQIIGYFTTGEQS